MLARLVIVAWIVGCGGTHQAPRARMELLTDVHGLSGLTVDDEGFLWAIGEDAPVVVRIDPSSGQTTPYAIHGMPPNVEAESIAWLPGGRFVVGTEGVGPPRPMDDIVYLSPFEGGLRVEGMVSCPYAQWGLAAEDNTGIEGLCAVGDDILVATEVVGDTDGRRFAPFAKRDASGVWTAYRVWLTSDGGKISGLHCEAGPSGGIRVLAIERHFGITRLLEFDLPGAASNDITPRVALQLDEWMEEQHLSPNFEGIVRMPDGRVAMIIDNFYRSTQTGTSALWWVSLD